MRLHRAGVHLLEIDFIRRGQRPLFDTEAVEPDEVKAKPYVVSLWRAHVDALQVWPVGLEERLPTVAVPLREPDPDVPLDLSSILATIYDVAAYDLSVDYGQDPPPPSFDEASARWIGQLLADYRHLS